MELPQITFNLILFALLGGLCVLGFFFGENRLKTISYGAFMAYFIILVSSDTFINDAATKANLKLDIAKFAFVGAVCAALFLGSLISQKKASDKIRSIILGLLTALFVVAFGVNTLPISARESLVTDFNLAAQVYNIRFIVMAALAAWLIIIQFVPKKRIDDDKKK